MASGPSRWAECRLQTAFFESKLNALQSPQATRLHREAHSSFEMLPMVWKVGEETVEPLANFLYACAGMNGSAIAWRMCGELPLKTGSLKPAAQLVKSLGLAINFVSLTEFL